MIHFIPVPIGNIEDITLRGLNLLKSLDVFFCEDTRSTKNLMKLYDIDYSNKQFHSLTSFTNTGKLNHYLNIVQSSDVGIVSDAGTPGLSDPGKEFVRLIWENDLDFEVLPGANALVPAIVGSGFDTSEFIYLGFLPKKKGKQTKMKFIIESDLPVFVYESVHRIEKNLLQIKELGFDGKVSVFRELSKKFEQKLCGHIDEILSKLSNGELVQKGEFVVGFYNGK